MSKMVLLLSRPDRPHPPELKKKVRGNRLEACPDATSGRHEAYQALVSLPVSLLVYSARTAKRRSLTPGLGPLRWSWRWSTSAPRLQRRVGIRRVTAESAFFYVCSVLFYKTCAL